jgi:hypothetical protein
MAVILSKQYLDFLLMSIRPSEGRQFKAVRDATGMPVVFRYSKGVFLDEIRPKNEKSGVYGGKVCNVMSPRGADGVWLF